MLQFLKAYDIKTRPHASNGVWLMFLLPLAIFLSSYQHSTILTPSYKLLTIFCLGLTISTIILILKNKLSYIWMVLASLLMTSIFHILSDKGLLFSLYSGLFCTIFYLKSYTVLLKKFLLCFTLGEGAIATQSINILLYFTLFNLIYVKENFQNENVSQISSIIIQMGLLGVGLIGWTANKLMKYIHFYTLSGFILLFATLLPLYVLLRRNPIFWILELLFHDVTAVKIILYWSFCVILAFLVVYKQISNAQKASTSIRKVFHILAVAVFIPGLLYKCNILYLASGVILGIFFALEMLRIFEVQPFGILLQDGFSVYSDEKDTGLLAVTPIYLLSGCSLPLWIHPGPCDLTDSALFNIMPLMSGVLAIGIGDTFASIVGSKLGKHFWKGSKKTVEGTIACILSQLFLVLALNYSGLINLTTIECVRAVIAVIAVSILEAKTDQVDNLVLPLVMYSILI